MTRRIPSKPSRAISPTHPCQPWTRKTGPFYSDWTHLCSILEPSPSHLRVRSGWPLLLLLWAHPYHTASKVPLPLPAHWDLGTSRSGHYRIHATMFSCGLSPAPRCGSDVRLCPKHRWLRRAREKYSPFEYRGFTGRP